MLRNKKGQSATEAAALISFLTFFMIVTLASVADDIATATDDSFKSDLQDLADVIEQEALIAFSSENGYYHSFVLPPTLNGRPYGVSMINSTLQTNDTYIFVSSGNLRSPINITKILSWSIHGNLAIGPNSVRKENGLTILRPPLLKAIGDGCSNDLDCTSGICGRDADGDSFFSQALGHTGTCQAALKPYTDCYDSNANAYPGQASYFTLNRGDGSFDYDCDGSGTKNPVINCGTTLVASGSCFLPPASVRLNGYVSAPSPACGASALFRTCTVYSVGTCSGQSASFGSLCSVGCPTAAQAGWAIGSWRTSASPQTMNCK